MSGKGKAVAGIMKPAVEFLVKHTDDVGGKVGKEAAEKAAKQAAEKAAKDAAEKTAKEAGQKAGQNSAKEVAEREAREAPQKATTKDPIDLATGEVLLTQTDAQLPGILPLVLERTHLSSHRRGRLFGMSWASTLDQHLEIEATGIAYAAADGMVLRFPLVNIPGVVTTPIAGSRHRQLVMNRDGGYTLTDLHTGRSLHFPKPNDRTGWSRLPLTAITDRNDNRIDLHYDEDGTLAQVQHSCGYCIDVDTRPFTPAGSLTIEPRIAALRLPVTDADGLAQSITLMRYGYDDNGDLSEVINESGLPLKLTYDTEHRLTSWQDRNGHRYDYTYDDQGRAIAGAGTGGHLNVRIEYGEPDASGTRRTVETNSLNYSTVYEFNRHLQLAGQIDPLGNTLRYERDDFNRITSIRDQLGRNLRFAYDDEGNLVKLIRPNGGTTVITYNELSLPVYVSEPGSRVWQYTYDARGNLTSVIDPVGAKTIYTYKANGHTQTICDPLGMVTRVQTDSAGLPIETVDPLGARTEIKRDVLGRVTSVKDPMGSVVHLGWTVKGKPAWRVSPDGAREDWSYDPEDNLIKYRDAAGNAVCTEIGVFDVPISRTGSDGTQLRFVYDSELNLVAVKDPTNLEWNYAYDAAGNLLEESDFNGRTVSYAYDSAGQLVSRTNGQGEVTAFVRDSAGKIIEKHVGDTVTTFTFNEAGQLLRAVSPDADLRFERDPHGRVISEICNGNVLSSGYDIAGNRTYRRTPSGVETILTYGASGLPLSMTVNGHSTTFNYDAAGREIQRNISSLAVMTQQWDASHRLTAQSVWRSPSSTNPSFPENAPAFIAGTGQPELLQHRTYTHRYDGSVIHIGDKLSGDHSYELDRAGRVTTVRALNWTEQYAYDAQGNLTNAMWPGFGAESDSQIEEISASALIGQREFDGTLIRRAGRLRFEHDGNGRMVLRQQARISSKPLTWRYHWDAQDRMVAAEDPDGQIWRYRYDALGRRISKECTKSSGATERTEFIWDGFMLIEEIRTTWSSARDSFARQSRTWDYEPDSFRPITQVTSTSNLECTEPDAQFYALVTDLVGTPIELIDSRGGITRISNSNLWGSTAPAADSPCPLRFPGQYYDHETGLHYNNQRYYDPSTARYLSSDPLGLDPQPNPYTYVPNPLNWLDPLGLSPCLDLDKASASGRKIDPKDKRQEYTKAGRALQKHAESRDTNVDGKWPLPTGKKNPQAWNELGQKQLDEILQDPRKQILEDRGRIMGVWQDTIDVRLPDGRGARFDLNSEFSGFLDGDKW